MHSSTVHPLERLEKISSIRVPFSIHNQKEMNMMVEEYEAEYLSYYFYESIGYKVKLKVTYLRSHTLLYTLITLTFSWQNICLWPSLHALLVCRQIPTNHKLVYWLIIKYFFSSKAPIHKACPSMHIPQ